MYRRGSGRSIVLVGVYVDDLVIAGVGGIAQPISLMGLMRRPKDLIVNIIPTRGPGLNCRPPPIYSWPKGSNGDSISPMSIFHSLECSLALAFCAPSVPFLLSAAWRRLLPNSLAPTACLAEKNNEERREEIRRE